MSVDGSTRVTVIGAQGRLGSALVNEYQQDPDTMVYEVVRGSWPTPQIAAERLNGVVIDASGPEALEQTVALCRSSRSALLYCVSNPNRDAELLEELSKEVAVCVAANLSPLHWIQERLAGTIAYLSDRLELRPSVTVTDRHPATKRDRPSASARRLTESFTGDVDVVVHRDGVPVSDHTVDITIDGEVLRIEHGVRDYRAAGSHARLLARWLHTSGPGLYTARYVYNKIAGVQEQ